VWGGGVERDRRLGGPLRGGSRFLAGKNLTRGGGRHEGDLKGAEEIQGALQKVAEGILPF